MLKDVWQICRQKNIFEIFRVCVDSHHLGVVVWRQDSFQKVSKDPKCFFFCHDLYNFTQDEVHPLTVPDKWVSVGVGLKYSPDTINERLIFPDLLLFLLIVWESRSGQVKFNLMKAWIRICWEAFIESLKIIWETFLLFKGHYSRAHFPNLYQFLLRKITLGRSLVINPSETHLTRLFLNSLTCNSWSSFKSSLGCIKSVFCWSVNKISTWLRGESISL